jgi:hypothetical protein
MDRAKLQQIISGGQTGVDRAGIEKFRNLRIEEFSRRKVEIILVWQTQSLNPQFLNC